MLSRISGASSFSRYHTSFIPASDAVLRPYEAETVDRLLQRTKPAPAASDIEPLDYVQLMQLAQEQRREYFAEHVPLWRHAAWSALKAAASRVHEAVASGFDTLWDWMDNIERARFEGYLSESTDLFDLERRIRAYEQNAARGAW